MKGNLGSIGRFAGVSPLCTAVHGAECRTAARSVGPGADGEVKTFIAFTPFVSPPWCVAARIGKPNTTGR